MAGNEAAPQGKAHASDGRRLRVCVLQCCNESTSGELAGLDPYRTVAAYDSDGKYEWEDVHIQKATAVRQIRDLVRSKRFDVFLNLCDGAYDEDRAGKEVVEALERFDVAYTGANAPFYEPSKEVMKKLAYYYGIPTPGWAFVYDLDDADPGVGVQDAVRGLRYPLIVKHHNGYSSVGMGRDCKVHDLEHLTEQVSQCITAFGGALVEEFIAGREFTVLVVENPSDPASPRALLPVECIFPPGEQFKHFDLKWTEYEGLSWVPLDVRKEPGLDAALRGAAAAAFVAARGTAYGRCDFRVDATGAIYFLEINPNCGVLYPRDAMGSADVILTLDPEMDHSRFIDHIIACGLERQRRQQRVVRVRHRNGVGYGLYAARTIAAGEVVVRHEERPHVLVSTRHAAREFGPDAVPGPCPGPSPPKAPYANGHGAANGTADVGEHATAQQSTANGGVEPLGGDGTARGGHNFRPQDLRQLKATWFKAYAYPVTDTTWVTWADDPEEWLPLNHSCDPNTWLDGMDQVARRDIAEGEEVTIDYATFCVHNMRDFECGCGAVTCRGVVRGTDYLEPWVGRVYGEHVSDYVAAKRAAAALHSEG